MLIHCLNKIWYKVWIPLSAEPVNVCILVRMADVLVFWLGRVFYSMYLTSMFHLRQHLNISILRQSIVICHFLCDF